MSIKFIDELTEGNDYIIFVRKNDTLVVNNGDATVKYKPEDIVTFLKTKIRESPYAQTYRKPRYIFSGDDGNGGTEEFTLTGKEDYLFIEA